jgi:hypothetical protein
MDSVAGTVVGFGSIVPRDLQIGKPDSENRMKIKMKRKRKNLGLRPVLYRRVEITGQ